MQPTLVPRAADWQRYSRHEVAFLYVIAVGYAIAITRRVPAGILRRRATVALMTGCEALLTMYRIGKKPRGGFPSGNPARLRARMGQYGESRQRSLCAVRLKPTYRDYQVEDVFPWVYTWEEDVGH